MNTTMRISYRHRTTYLANPSVFLAALKPVLDDSFGVAYEPPTGTAERAVYDELKSDLDHDRERTARIRAERHGGIA